MKPPVEPTELASLGDHLRSFWEMRDTLGAFIHFRKPLRTWTQEHLKSERLQRLFTRVFPDEAPALLLLFGLGYLRRGWLSRPLGGTARFRDAIVETYRRLGGEAILHATVDEILVEGERACGVRLDDGTMIRGDAVVSTSSGPETVLRLLGGRYGAEATRERMARWRMFEPIVLASFGVDVPLAEVPATLLVDRVAPFDVGGRANDQLYLRVCSGDTGIAPHGHAVVQAMIQTEYAWWATRGSQYQNAKQAAAEIALAQIESAIPEVRGHVRMTDIATPLTFWNTARSWRGAYEGWMPNPEAIFGHVPKTLPKLDGLVMAGQWVEPGGGVPTAILSGRQAAQNPLREGREGVRLEPCEGAVEVGRPETAFFAPPWHAPPFSAITARSRHSQEISPCVVSFIPPSARSRARRRPSSRASSAAGVPSSPAPRTRRS